MGGLSTNSKGRGRSDVYKYDPIADEFDLVEGVNLSPGNQGFGQSVIRLGPADLPSCEND